MRYVTTDLDWPTRTEIVTAWYRVAHVTDTEPEGRLSQSGHGVHIRSHARRPAETRINEQERRYCLDDPKRIKGDNDGDLYHKQVLFSSPHPWVSDLTRLVQQYQRECTLTPTQHDRLYGES